MIYQKLIDRFYPADDALRRLLLLHSRQVACRSLAIVERHPELGADASFVEDAAMVHDIGIFLTDAPGIHCCGSEPYLLHGRLGADLLRREAAEAGVSAAERRYYEALARVCERHTGTGLKASTILSLGLPIEAVDLLPETIEEQIVCYADKFYSKSHPERERTIEQTAQSLAKFGDECAAKIMEWAAAFEPERIGG